MKHTILFLFIALPFLLTGQANDRNAIHSSTNNTTTFDALEWRCIGPYRGGRANTIAGVIGDDNTYYAGYTGGGVWKTEDAGATWKNLSDGYFQVGGVSSSHLIY